MKDRRLKVGLGQVLLVMGDKRGNVARLLDAVQEAGRRRCDAVVLPECPLAGWLANSARRHSEPVPGPYTRKLSRLARRFSMIVVSGIEERAGRRIYNSAVLIGRDGRVLLRHRKINELDIGLKIYSRGEALQIVDVEGFKIGLDICADSWGPEITDTLYLMGARLILSPSAWAVSPGGERENIGWILGTYQKRTAGRDLTILSANSVGKLTEGPWRGRILQGDSLGVGPRGRKLLQGPTNQAAFLETVVRV